jgi:hypothetical protein
MCLSGLDLEVGIYFMVSIDFFQVKSRLLIATVRTGNVHVGRGCPKKVEQQIKSQKCGRCVNYSVLAFASYKLCAAQQVNKAKNTSRMNMG